MKAVARPSWLLIFVMAAITAALAWQARGRLLAATRERMARQYGQQIAALPDRQAARLVSQLAQDDDQWLEVVVAASADGRTAIAAAAESELRNRVLLWAELPSAESSPLVASLASLLAQQAGDLPAERRHLAHSLAQRLITWPVDGSRVDMARFIADCQTVLLLLPVEPTEIRVATAEPPAAAGVSPTAPPIDPPVTLPPVPSAPSVKPTTLPRSNESMSREPGRFVAPKAMRISDY